MKKVIILDFGSQYTQLIARKIRELGIFSEILPFTASLPEVQKQAAGAVILSGGPQSVYDQDAPMPSIDIEELEVPVLGICYGLQLMSDLLGGKVVSSQKREYGFASLEIKTKQGLLEGLGDHSQVWMSHGDRVLKVPPGFTVTGVTENCDTAVIENQKDRFFGVQFHPEVIHTHQGKKVLSNFLFKIAGMKPNWNMESFIQRKVQELRELIKDEKVICGLSGGVDSLVTSLLVKKAVDKNLTCIFVNNGLLRKGQFESLIKTFRSDFDLHVVAVDATESFLRNLKGVIEPEKKRKSIGREFIKIFEREAKKIGDVKFLAQGTIYPDVIESNPVTGPSSSIKSHHNVGGLPRDLSFDLVEPLKELFKDEVRKLGMEMGIKNDFITQHPFPGPGLAVRVVGEVTEDRLKTIREADAVVIEEVRRAGVYHDLWQAFAVLLPVKSVGVMGDKRTYQRVVVVRLVQSVDGMTAGWFPADPSLLSRISTRIVNEVNGVNRVVYDITSKPPGTIEWE
ncbi:MAG: glutamine-hydrolyzing GMP synthase [Candidatus Aminicenantes bacterium]|nr:glutamine-hydrolyzing GMP synthase [Candidatus Aminicenantes bacterium]